MTVGVVADGMPAPENLLQEFRVAPDFFANEKKRGARTVCIEEVKDFRCAFWIGTVVNGEPDFAVLGGEVGHHRAESAGRWLQYLKRIPRRGRKEHDDRPKIMLKPEEDERSDICPEK